MQTPPPSPDHFPATSLSVNQRLIMVSNRLPVTIERTGDGKCGFKPSCGGLATGMSGVKREFEMLWYGWPGIEISSDEEPSITQALREEHNAVPVLIEDHLAEAYYNGFSNSTLWPLLHYQSSAIRFHRDEWKAYQEVNQRFADRLANDIMDGDLVWVHDYHLMLLPLMLSEAALKLDKRITVGFFLHTPFPSGDMFKVLPVWDRILEGLLRCKTIGFHTYTYAQNFARTCRDHLGYQQFSTGIRKHGSLVDLGVYPIGIDVPKFLDHLQDESTQEQTRDMRRRYNVCKLILGVDRLDYTKGIPQKFRALELFLDTSPQFVGQVSMIQVIVPSREGVQDYKDLAMNVHQQVEALNKKYGYNDYKPVHLIHQSVPFDQLMAMYGAADICFVSSIRDGLNLVSYEYVITQRKRHGVLLLSEFAGAAENLRGSVLFNPWDLDGTVEALRQAMIMAPNERIARQKQPEDHVLQNSSSAWGRSFVENLYLAQGRC